MSTPNINLEESSLEEERIVLIKKSHSGKALDYKIENQDGVTSEEVLKQSKKKADKILRKDKHTPSKNNFKLHCMMKHINPETGESKEEEEVFFSTPALVIQSEEDISEVYDEASEILAQKLYKFMSEGSGWSIKDIPGVHIHISLYDPINGSCYTELPPFYKNKKYLVNIKNKDNMCGKWAITISLNPPLDNNHNKGRVTKQVIKDSKKYDWTGVSFPMQYPDILQFEKNNPNIGVIAYIARGDSGKDLENIVRLCKTKKNLPDENIAKIFCIKKHWCPITNLQAFLNKGERNEFLICENCGYKAQKDGKRYSAKDRLSSHMRYCNHHDFCTENFPKVGENILKFNTWDATVKHPIVISFDFECLLPKCDEGNMKKSKMIEEHIPISWGIYVSRFDEKNQYFTYTGEDAPKKFVEKMDEICKNWYEEFKYPRRMKNVMEANEALKRENLCWICKKEFGTGKWKPVRDHCHFSGKFRGIAHDHCNKQVKNPKFIPVFAHNLSGYDEKLFIRNLVDNGYIRIIPKNEENFISFSKYIETGSYIDNKGEKKKVKREIRFLDSFRFLSTSLSTLVENMDRKDFKNLGKEYFGEKFDLLCKKGIYPYGYMTREERLYETNLPSLKHWYNKMTGKYPTYEEYERAKRVWEVFGCKTMKDYQDLYLKSDVLLLADVLETFRNMSLEYYKLDPAHFFTTPSLGWQALLKNTGVEFELFDETQSEMHRMVEMGIRGGVVNCVTRYAKVNNKYMKEYNREKVSSFIKYLDKNGLYAGIMRYCPLPLKNFEWMSEDDDWEKICEEEGKGCILEVDLDYPEGVLKEKYNQFPLAPERGKKLIPNLDDKRFYVLHYRNLQCYLKQGMKLVKIHKGIKFDESCWMAPYIDLNVELRKEARNEFEKDFFKLMNNAPFGKTMENVRNRVNIEAPGTDKEFEKLVRRVSFQSRKILSENLSLVHFRKLEVTLNKPIVLGMCILDLSKIVMIEFFYDYLIPKYGNKVKLLYTDTDSLILWIQTEDFYMDIKDEVESMYDTSNFSKDHPAMKDGFPVGVNKKILLMMKDESGGKEIREFVGLGPKIYSFRMDDDCLGEGCGKVCVDYKSEICSGNSSCIESKKVKGVKKVVTRTELTFEDLDRCRLTDIPVIKKVRYFKSRDHNIFTMEMDKVALKSEDDKRYTMEDRIHTLAPGHPRLLGGGKYLSFEIPYPEKELGKLYLK